MKVLVTGAAGRLGIEVVRHLLRWSHPRIRCLVRPTSDALELERLGAGERRVEVVYGTLQSAGDAQRATDGCEAVVHLAAGKRGAPADIFLDTVVGTQRLIEAMSRARIARTVLVSSINVYDTARLPTHLPVTEEAALDRRPWQRDAYTYAKVMQEQVVSSAPSEAVGTLVVLRPALLHDGGIGGDVPARVGLRIGHLVARLAPAASLVPRTHLSLCATAITQAVRGNLSAGTYNVIDPVLPTASEWLASHAREGWRVVGVPWWTVVAMSRTSAAAEALSRGQLPAPLTPYRAAAMWRGHQFSGERLRVALASRGASPDGHDLVKGPPRRGARRQWRTAPAPASDRSR